MLVYKAAFPPLTHRLDHISCRFRSSKNTPRRTNLQVCASATFAVPNSDELRLRRIQFSNTCSVENERGDCFLALRSPMSLVFFAVHIKFILSVVPPSSNTRFKVNCRTSSGRSSSGKGAGAMSRAACLQAWPIMLLEELWVIAWAAGHAVWPSCSFFSACEGVRCQMLLCVFVL